MTCHGDFSIRSTVADSDLLVCLSKGEVAEVGSPQVAWRDQLVLAPVFWAKVESNFGTTKTGDQENGSNLSSIDGGEFDVTMGFMAAIIEWVRFINPNT